MNPLYQSQQVSDTKNQFAFQFMKRSHILWTHQIDWTADVTVHQQDKAIDQITGKHRSTLNF